MRTAAAPTVAPFRFCGLTVLRARRLSPSMQRVTFGYWRRGMSEDELRQEATAASA